MATTALGNCTATLLDDPMQIDLPRLEAIIEATVEAGFDALGLWAFHLLLAGPDSVAVVKDSGLPVGAVDATISWPNRPSDSALAEIDGLIAQADELGADRVVAVMLSAMTDRGAAEAGLAQIASRSEEAGKVIALEFLPWTGVPSLAVANELCDAAGSPAATILLDCWHWTRQPGGPDLELLRSLPGDRISYLQLSDASPTPSDDPEREAMTGRPLPGEGVVDFASIFDALDHIGAEPFVAAEVLNSELAALGPRPMAEAVAAACRRSLP